MNGWNLSKQECHRLELILMKLAHSDTSWAFWHFSQCCSRSWFLYSIVFGWNSIVLKINEMSKWFLFLTNYFNRLMDLPWIEVELPLECLSISSIFLFCVFILTTTVSIDKMINGKRMKQKMGKINLLIEFFGARYPISS